jgi:enoyl-CoA hydratase
MNDLIIEPQGTWVRLVLNRPQVKNALNTALLARLDQVLTDLAVDPGCRAVMICGAEGNFAAGADIAEIEGKTSHDAAHDPRKAHWAAIRGFAKPMVAAVDGFALGGGFELALMADLMVLGMGAKVGLPETNLGIIPGAGGGQRLLALVGSARAARMVLMAEVIDAETAFAWGIGSYLVPDALAQAALITEKLARRAPLALQAAKASLIAGQENALALRQERAAFEALLDSEDKAEGIAAFLAKRRAEFKGR